MFFCLSACYFLSHRESISDSISDIDVLFARLSSLKYSSVVLKETVLGMALSYLEWHNIVFSYVDTLDGSTSLGKVFCLLSCLFIVMWTTVTFFFWFILHLI